MSQPNERIPQPARVLVVDDDALVAMSMVSLLEDLGHVVLEASSGQQALAIVRDDASIDLVITDQSMPGMSGTELAREIAATRPGIPVMLATGYRDVPEGSDLHLPQVMKPYDDETVGKAVTEILRNRASQPKG